MGAGLLAGSLARMPGYPCLLTDGSQPAPSEPQSEWKSFIDGLWTHERDAEAKADARNKLDACVVAGSRFVSEDPDSGATKTHQLLRAAIEMAEQLVDQDEASVHSAQAYADAAREVLLHARRRFPQNGCTLSGGERVAEHWSGRDTGSNSCNSCECANGRLTCTKLRCQTPPSEYDRWDAHEPTAVPIDIPQETPFPDDRWDEEQLRGERTGSGAGNMPGNMRTGSGECADEGFEAMSCAQLARYCRDPRYGEAVRANCRKTCGACLPRTQPTAQTPMCRDQAYTGLTFNNRALSCGQLAGYCDDPSHGSQVRDRCPRTCNVCHLRPAPSCTDATDTGLTLQGRSASCRQLAPHCADGVYGVAIREKCPATCNSCPAETRGSPHSYPRSQRDRWHEKARIPSFGHQQHWHDAYF